MIFECNTDCYDSTACVGYRFGKTYEFGDEELSRLKKNGMFPKRFNAVDKEAKDYVKAPKPAEIKEEPKPEIKKPATR
jgi:hypothetical protein